MVDVRPFQGWRYNQARVGNLASVFCPPYDIIGPEQQRALQAQSAYNAVHLELAVPLEEDVSAQYRYAQAAAVFEEWLKEGVLQRDPEPCFYLLRYGYRFRGQSRVELALFGCVRLEEYDARQVLPHEYTRETAVRDRIALMEACNTNFSPIMGLYRDRSKTLPVVFEQAMAGPPCFSVGADSEQELTLWRIADSALQQRVRQVFAGESIFLADGHHRYEAALRIRRQRQTGADKSASPDAAYNFVAYNFVMMALIEFDDPGLMVLPYHRVVGKLSPAQAAGIQERLGQLFDAQPPSAAARESIEGLLDEVASRGREGKVMGLVGANSQGPHLLTLREGVDWRQWGPLAVSEGWILEEQVLRPVLGEATPRHLDYVHDHHEALEQIATGVQQMAFMLKPFPMDEFEAIVSQGGRLPAKSTFFYPKLPTGLVINQLEGTL